MGHDWTLANVYKTKHKLIESRCERDVLDHFLLKFAGFKLWHDCFAAYPEDKIQRKYIFRVFDLCFPDIEMQKAYQTSLDRLYKFEDKDLLKGKSLRSRPSYFNDPFLAFMQDIDADILISPKSFPKFWVPSKHKTERYSFAPLEISSSSFNEFEFLMKNFLDKYCPKRLFVPSVSSCWKAGSQKYNDGGTVKHDYEKPCHINSPFKFQEFMTGPLVTREVWLPDKKTKVNNSFIFAIFDQVIRVVSYYAGRFDNAHDLHGTIKQQLFGQLVEFDISGFGLQFPRELLRKTLKLFLDMYLPDDELSSEFKVTDDILDKVVIEFEDGVHKYPNRGIGLGYYEVLKTICILAILEDKSPISVFGDQGFFRVSDDLRSMRMYQHGSAWVLDTISHFKKFGFVFDDYSKVSVNNMNRSKGILWRGALMNSSDCVIRKKLWSDVQGALEGEFHWERKAALRGVEVPQKYMYIWKRIAFLYDKLFGYEFYPGESMSHPDNLGVCMTAPKRGGLTKDYKVKHLVSPKVSYDGNTLLSFPFADPPRAGESRRFQTLRRRIYKQTIPYQDWIFDYIHPMIEYNLNRHPPLSSEARSVPEWMALRELVFNHYDVGKLSYGMKEGDIDVAPYRQRYAGNPFYARSTGGYKITTSYFAQYGETEEWREYADALLSARKQHGKYIVRHDMIAKARIEDFWHKSLHEVSEPPAKRPRVDNPYVAKASQLFSCDDEKSQVTLKLFEDLVIKSKESHPDALPAEDLALQWDYIPEISDDLEDEVIDDVPGNIADLLDMDFDAPDSPTYVPESPKSGPLLEDSDEHTWVL
jgi:hypothetical protein